MQARNVEESEDVELIPSAPLEIDDPRRMQLTEEEHTWATDVKAMVEMDPEVDNLPDFMYAQIALISKGDLEDSMRRVQGLQAFRQEYKILDTHRDGCRRLQTIFVNFPRHLLSFRFSPMEDTYVLIHDITKLDASVLTTHEKVADWMASGYYLHTAMSPDLATIRKGPIVIVECEGMEMSFKKGFKHFRNLSAELLAFYPCDNHGRFFHTGLIVNLLATACRRLSHDLLKDKFETGFTFEGRLDEYYLVPDVDTANARTLSGLEDALKKRYEHEQNFKL